MNYEDAVAKHGSGVKKTFILLLKYSRESKSKIKSVAMPLDSYNPCFIEDINSGADDSAIYKQIIQTNASTLLETHKSFSVDILYPEAVKRALLRFKLPKRSELDIYSSYLEFLRYETTLDLAFRHLMVTKIQEVCKDKKCRGLKKNGALSVQLEGIVAAFLMILFEKQALNAYFWSRDSEILTQLWTRKFQSDVILTTEVTEKRFEHHDQTGTIDLQFPFSHEIYQEGTRYFKSNPPSDDLTERVDERWLESTWLAS
eukprot:CAMPEP_0115001072 /NCGR_PEP_ID=MMETSP0216-20121206/17148_1 /TAXON_ID=223996 /ORGANISM="Protocruzia adherens, Strain Boccale" /LENGTH=257 /DNA_ID=CAMNT_0002366317 /DNA_START=290 /DNA_END=1060 /DNA_ORIENTATION=+